MKISDLANAVGCHVETVRYYEKERLLPPAKRAKNGYRNYSDTHLKLLYLIRNAKELGFSQLQIRELVRLSSGKDACEDMHKMTLTQLDIVAKKITELRKLQRGLKELAAACDENRQDECPILERLTTGKY